MSRPPVVAHRSELVFLTATSPRAPVSAATRITSRPASGYAILPDGRNVYCRFTPDRHVVGYQDRNRQRGAIQNLEMSDVKVNNVIVVAYHLLDAGQIQVSQENKLAPQIVGDLIEIRRAIDVVNAFAVEICSAECRTHRGSEFENTCLC